MIDNNYASSDASNTIQFTPTLTVFLLIHKKPATGVRLVKRQLASGGRDGTKFIRCCSARSIEIFGSGFCFQAGREML